MAKKRPLTGGYGFSKEKAKSLEIGGKKGYRELTKAELRLLGYSETSRRYTSQKEGVKDLQRRSLSDKQREVLRSKTISRRQVLSTGYGAILNPASERAGKAPKISPEKAAKLRRMRTGGASSHTRAGQTARTFAATHNISVREAQRSPEYKRQYKAMLSKGQSVAAKRKRIEALAEFYPERSQYFLDLLTHGSLALPEEDEEDVE